MERLGPLNGLHEMVQDQAYLYLLYSKVEEREVIADTYGTFRPRAAHAGPQASIQFDLPLSVVQ